MDQWIAEIKREKEALDSREQQLKELETRLNAERQEIATVTQSVYQLQADFDQNVIRLKSQDTDHLKRQVKLISSMTPEGAAATLTEMNDADVVRLLVTMKPADASVLLESMSKQGKDQAQRAAVLIERISRTFRQRPPPIIRMQTFDLLPASHGASPLNSGTEFTLKHRPKAAKNSVTSWTAP